MQNNDVDNRLPGIDTNDRKMGTTDCPENKQKLEAWSVGISTGYRWLKVNDFLHIYMSASVEFPSNINVGNPSSEVLAYVQHLPSGKFRAIRAAVDGNIVMPIPFGTAKELKAAVEIYIQSEKSLLS